MKQQNTTYIVIAVISLIIGFVLGAWWKEVSLGGKATFQVLDEEATTTLPTEMQTLQTNTQIYVPNQYAGSKVVVDTVSVKDVSWVVISEDADGKPARILGAQLFNPGDVKGEVQLLRNTVPGETYHAVIYNDDGDNQFDYKVDSPIQDDNGGLIESIFKTS